ncbi:MAG: tannase/feruloyl esterase family alpha/beta hydrolase [Kiritimatiellae bacterium]|nr:tannase/feruloyl esterase family alpha/beta hydrolase [Kiritimatiellia bacterium]
MKGNAIAAMAAGLFSLVAVTGVSAATPAGGGACSTGAAANASTESAESRLRAVKLEGGGTITLIKRLPKGLQVSFTLAPTPKSFIRCELGLADPEKWDGRFWGLGNGGWAGKTYVRCDGVSAYVHTDLGTSRSPYRESPTDREILRDYAWRATHLMTVNAKRIVEAYYGRAPDKSYFLGASCGGRQGIQEASRFPEDYDGIVSEVPGLTERSRCSHTWRREMLKKKHGKWFSAKEMSAVREAELAYFAKTDPEFAHGRFIIDPYPTKAKLDGCWAEIVARNPGLADREQLWRELFEPVMVNGKRYAAGRLIGIEFTSAWTFLLPKYVGPRNASTTTEADLEAVAAEADVWPPADLTAFKARGGKIIMYGGLEDLSCPEPEIREYYNAVIRGMDTATAASFFAYYTVPGRSHGAKGEPSGPGQVGFPIGLNKKIVDWVERGVHPGAVSFKWHHEPKVLVVTPHPDNKATCTSL